MEDFKKALEGTLGRKHIDNIVDQVASFPDRTVPCADPTSAL